MKRILIGLAISLVAAAASAEWVLVGENKIGSKVFSDPATKRRLGSTVRIWEITDYAAPRVLSGIAYYSDRIYWQYDCVDRTSQYLQAAGYSGQMGTGLQVGPISELGKKLFIPPGSVGETTLDFACK